MLKNFYKRKKKESPSPKQAGTPRLIKGGKGESDSARLARMKKEQKAFEKTLPAKKKAQTSKFGLFGMTAKELGIKGGPGPTGKKLKRMSGGGMATSKYYSSGGKVITGR
jgi:hypothetical protein